MSYQKILLLPHIKIHNANAHSSPFSIGFPAITAWLGFSHALERELKARDFTVLCAATGIVSHQFNLQTYKGTNDFVSSIIGTGNPLDKTGQRSSFIEEARCHLDVSIIIELEGCNVDDEAALIELVSHLLHSKMKVAGGDIMSFNPPEILLIDSANEGDLRRLKRKLMPGYAIIERRDQMIEAMEQGQDAMDALLDSVAIHHQCETQENGQVSWKSGKKALDGKPAGWLIPITTGFHGISEVGSALNQRDPDTPHRFAESIVTLAEFKMPHRFYSLNSMLWEYQVDISNNLYQCVSSQLARQNQQDEFI